MPDGLRDGMGERAEEFIHPIPENPEKYHVDLKGANRRWLMDAGVDPSHIAVCQVCTGLPGGPVLVSPPPGRAPGQFGHGDPDPMT